MKFDRGPITFVFILLVLAMSIFLVLRIFMISLNMILIKIPMQKFFTLISTTLIVDLWRDFQCLLHYIRRFNKLCNHSKKNMPINVAMTNMSKIRQGGIYKNQAPGLLAEKAMIAKPSDHNHVPHDRIVV